MTVQDGFFLLLSHALCERELTEETLAELRTVDLASLHRLALSQDLAHLVGSALDSLGLLSDDGASSLFRSSMLQAALRCERQRYECERIYALLEAEGIAFLPLKGAVLRDLYPIPWWRTSCDVDILVREEELSRAASLLSERLGYTAERQRSYHDLSLYAENGVHLELHFSLLENDARLDRVLSRVWDYAAPVCEGSSRMALTREFLLFHQLAHMAYHLLCGGCGVRPFLDVFCLRERLSPDAEALSPLLREASLEDFYRGVLSLLSVWLLGEEATPFTNDAQRYLLEGGVYGSAPNAMAVRSREGKDGLRYLLGRLFPSYTELSHIYPVLRRHPWLMPLMTVRRWGSALFHGGPRRLLRMLRPKASPSAEKKERAERLLAELGL